MSTARTDKPSAHAVFFGETARSLYEGNAAGTIVGVFSHALYVSVGGEMLSFYDAAYGEVPFGVAVYDILAFLAAAEPAVGDAVALADGEIRIGGRALADGEIRIGGRALAVDVLLPPVRILTPLAPPDEGRLTLVEDYIAAHGSPRGMLELIGANRGHAADSTAALATAFRRGNAEAASLAATRLLGLGRGLTPSGDDYLCGFFSALLAARRAGIALPMPLDAVIGAVLAAAPARTSPISGAYLAAALGGRYCTVYAAATAACLGEGSFAPFADTALRMGASSGTDTLCGALAAAKLLAK